MTAQSELIDILRMRFEKNTQRHKGIAWKEVEAALAKQKKALKSLLAMEETGGEPDVIGKDRATGEIIFCDCSVQSPSGRRSVCYDGVARKSRKKHAPESSAVEMAAELGISLLTEDEYRNLQKLGEFDTTTSSWIVTPTDVRELGGALFCDRRFGKVFVYHNGADSYYAARGFRGVLRV